MPSPRTRDVIVDLRELTFADSSLMLDLAMVARRLRKAGRRLHLRNAQPQVWRVIELVGVNRLPGVVADEPDPAPRLTEPAPPPRAGRRRSSGARDDAAAKQRPPVPAGRAGQARRSRSL